MAKLIIFTAHSFVNGLKLLAQDSTDNHLAYPPADETGSQLHEKRGSLLTKKTDSAKKDSVEKKTPFNTERRVNLYFIRHGESELNEDLEKSTFPKMRLLTEAVLFNSENQTHRDAVLSGTGKEQCKGKLQCEIQNILAKYVAPSAEGSSDSDQRELKTDRVSKATEFLKRFSKARGEFPTERAAEENEKTLLSNENQNDQADLNFSKKLVLSVPP